MNITTDSEHTKSESISEEEQVWQQQLNLKAIFDAAPVGMLLIDENTVKVEL